MSDEQKFFKLPALYYFLEILERHMTEKTTLITCPLCEKETCDWFDCGLADEPKD